jgi:hypothetical protein
MFDISIVSAFLAGLLSFVSPCILPIVPFYLSYLAGVGMNQISSDSEIDSATRRRAVLAAMFFAAGVITIFMGLGAAATSFGQVVREYFDILRWVAAAIIITMGLHFLGVIKIALLYRQMSFDTENVEPQPDRLLCGRSGLCFWLDPLCRSGSGGDFVYRSWCGNGLEWGLAALGLWAGNDIALHHCGFLHCPIHALDGAVSAALGAGGKSNGCVFDCFWIAHRDKFYELYCAMDVRTCAQFWAYRIGRDCNDTFIIGRRRCFHECNHGVRRNG